MTDRPQWRFREMQPGEINVDPIEGEFFTKEAIGSITDALVRESIQNSLDAALGDIPVTVRFSFFSRPNPGYDAKVVSKRYIDPDCDDDWPSLWLKLACSLPGIPLPPQVSKPDQVVWIEKAVESFCTNFNMLEKFVLSLQDTK